MREAFIVISVANQTPIVRYRRVVLMGNQKQIGGSPTSLKVLGHTLYMEHPGFPIHHTPQKAFVSQGLLKGPKVSAPLETQPL